MAGRAGGYEDFDMHGYSSYHAGAPASAAGGAAAGRNMTNERGRLVQIISTNIHKLTQNVDQMNRLINQIGTPSDTMDLHDKLHQVQHYSNQLAKETSQYLKDLTKLPSTGSQSEQREYRLQQERLLNSFTTALNSFQAAQRKQKDKETIHRVRARGFMSANAFGSDDASEKLVSLEGVPAKPQQQQQQQLVEEDDEEVELLRDREQSMRQLESDIMDVNQIFKDLSVLIHEQGDIVDSIEANVERSALNVERGNEQLLQARNYQAKVRRRKLCILVIVLVIVSIIAIIIGVSVSSSKN